MKSARDIAEQLYNNDVDIQSREVFLSIIEQALNEFADAKLESAKQFIEDTTP